MTDGLETYYEVAKKHDSTEVNRESCTWDRDNSINFTLVDWDESDN